MKLLAIVATLLVTTGCEAEHGARILLIRPVPKSNHTEMQTEAALAKIDAQLREHGFQSRSLHGATASHFATAPNTRCSEPTIPDVPWVHASPAATLALASRR